MDGRLMVLSTPIGNLGDLSPRAAEALCEADLVLAEDTRRTGRLLAHVGASAPQRSLHEHNEDRRVAAVIDEIRSGMVVALVTDAGTPAISDPGFRLVAACAEAGVRVEPIPGPSAVLAALAASGLPTDRFVFEGFLPRRGEARSRRLSELTRERRTILVFVTPHRAVDDLDDLATHLGGERRATLARELTKIHEEIVYSTLSQLVDRVRSGVRGELTLVVAGTSDEAGEPVSDAELIERVRARVATGTSTRDAVAQVAREAGVPRRPLYQKVVER